MYPSVTLPPPPPLPLPLPLPLPPPPPSTESPLIQPWEGDYTTIEPNDTTWGSLKENETFQPIIVDQTKSNMQKLVYKFYDTTCPVELWDSNDCGHLTNPNFIAFKNFKDAFEYISRLPPPAPAPGGGKRTKKKGKRQTHKKHTRRHRRRAAN